jgi:hypothetical protein
MAAQSLSRNRESMTDFLSTLLVRNTFTGPNEEILRPRLYSRFEQVSTELQQDEVETSPAAIELPYSQPEDLLSRQFAPRPVFTNPRDETNSDLVTPRLRPATLQSRQRHTLHTAPGAVAPLAADADREDPKLPSRPIERMEQWPSPLQAYSAHYELQPAQRAGPETPVDLSIRPRMSIEPAIAEPAARPDGKEPGQVSPAPMPQLSFHQPSLPSGTIFSQSLPEVDGTLQPTIYVSIGRVEVRAVQSNPAPAQGSMRKTAPVISLEEHLRRRGGGEA